MKAHQETVDIFHEDVLLEVASIDMKNTHQDFIDQDPDTFKDGIRESVFFTTDFILNRDKE